jgi:hypothetical protein
MAENQENKLLFHQRPKNTDIHIPHMRPKSAEKENLRNKFMFYPPKKRSNSFPLVRAASADVASDDESQELSTDVASDDESQELSTDVASGDSEEEEEEDSEK